MIAKSLCPERLLVLCVSILISTATYSAGWSGAAMSSNNGFNAGCSSIRSASMSSTSMYLHASTANYSSYYSRPCSDNIASTTYGETSLLNSEYRPTTGLRTDGPNPPIINPEDELPLGDALLPLCLLALTYMACILIHNAGHDANCVAMAENLLK